MDMYADNWAERYATQAELDGVNLGDGEDRAQPSRGTGRESIPDAAGAAKATLVSPVADKSASSPDPSNGAVHRPAEAGKEVRHD